MNDSLTNSSGIKYPPKNKIPVKVDIKTIEQYSAKKTGIWLSIATKVRLYYLIVLCYLSFILYQSKATKSIDRSVTS